MQILRDMHAQISDLHGRLQKVGNHDGHHASRKGGSNAII